MNQEVFPLLLYSGRVSEALVLFLSEISGRIFQGNYLDFVRHMKTLCIIFANKTKILGHPKFIENTDSGCQPIKLSMYLLFVCMCAVICRIIFTYLKIIISGLSICIFLNSPFLLHYKEHVYVYLKKKQCCIKIVKGSC